MRAATRSLLVDSVVALVLGWMCWSAAVFHWGPDGDPMDLDTGPPGRRGGPPPPWLLDRPEVADWVLAPVLAPGFGPEPYLGLLNPSLYAGVVFGVALAIVPALFALLRRSRRESERVAREQDRRRYAYEERMRIARDVHDVVGHSLSVITMQAGVALHVLDRRPDQVAESLEAIRSTSREALAELRMTLEMFRDPEAGGPRAPVPGLARLDDMVGALPKAGRTVPLERVPPADSQPLPGAVDQAAFRIIQEGLTNVVRHAGNATATERVIREPGRLEAEVADDGPPT